MNKVKTFSDYMNDESRVSAAEREQIQFEIELIGKVIEARKEKGLSQRDLAELSGVKQPAIARLESMQSTPKIDTLIRILNPLGYTLSIVSITSFEDGSRTCGNKSAETIVWISVYLFFLCMIFGQCNRLSLSKYAYKSYTIQEVSFPILAKMLDIKPFLNIDLRLE